MILGMANTGAVDYSKFSDSELDKAYDVARKAGQSAVYTRIASEILSRLAGVWSFATGIFGGSRFPLFESYPNNFQQSTEAQTAVSNSASNLVSNFGTGAKMVVAFVAILAVVFVVIKARK